MGEIANNAVDEAILLALIFDDLDEKTIVLASLKLTIWKMNLNQMLRNRSSSISDRMNVLKDHKSHKKWFGWFVKHVEA
jgi:hypothetical protein